MARLEIMKKLIISMTGDEGKLDCGWERGGYLCPGYFVSGVTSLTSNLRY